MRLSSSRHHKIQHLEKHQKLLSGKPIRLAFDSQANRITRCEMSARPQLQLIGFHVFHVHVRHMAFKDDSAQVASGRDAITARNTVDGLTLFLSVASNNGGLNSGASSTKCTRMKFVFNCGKRTAGRIKHFCKTKKQ